MLNILTKKSYKNSTNWEKLYNFEFNWSLQCNQENIGQGKILRHRHFKTVK